MPGIYLFLKISLENKIIKLDPSFAQLRSSIAEYIAIPLGSPFAKEKLKKENFFLFYGAKGTGKSLVVRALAAQCNAIVIDISPNNLEGKYQDGKSL